MVWHDVAANRARRFSTLRLPVRCTRTQSGFVRPTRVCWPSDHLSEYEIAPPDAPSPICACYLRGRITVHQQMPGTARQGSPSGDLAGRTDTAGSKVRSGIRVHTSAGPVRERNSARTRLLVCRGLSRSSRSIAPLTADDPRTSVSDVVRKLNHFVGRHDGSVFDRRRHQKRCDKSTRVALPSRYLLSWFTSTTGGNDSAHEGHGRSSESQLMAGVLDGERAC